MQISVSFLGGRRNGFPGARNFDRGRLGRLAGTGYPKGAGLSEKAPKIDSWLAWQQTLRHCQYLVWNFDAVRCCERRHESCLGDLGPDFNDCRSLDISGGRTLPCTRESLFVRSGLPSFRDSEFADPGCIFRGWLFRFLGCFREDSIEVFIHSLRVGGQGAVLSLFSGSFAPGFAEARFCPLYTREFPGPSGTGIGTACGKIDG